MEVNMTQTVIALFDNSNEAREAVKKLANEGFSRENIDISVNTENTELENYKDTNESGIGRFFRSLFGDNDDEADKYTNVAQRGGSVVTVHAMSAEDAQRAANILDSCGAIDVNEKATEYGYTTNSGITNKESMDSRSGKESTSIPVV